ncbi:MAG TPA: hypothetical protein VN549_06345 [Negativicutes bacterium]|nr:hypothetical protein [Negativicutes bacterium]
MGAKIAINYRSDPQKARSLSEELEGRFGTETYMVYGDISMEAYVRSMFEEVQSFFRN